MKICFKGQNQNSKEKLKNNLETLEQQECLLLKPLEILSFLYPKSFLCINLSCPKFINKASFEANNLVLPSEEENKTSFLEIKSHSAACRICYSQLIGLDKEKKNYIDNIPDLKRIIEKRNEFILSLSKNINFLTIDLRRKKSFTGVLLKSHLINPKPIESISEELMNDFIEFKSKFHFSFLVSENTQELQNSENFTKRFERFSTQYDELIGINKIFNFSIFYLKNTTKKKL